MTVSDCWKLVVVVAKIKYYPSPSSNHISSSSISIYLSGYRSKSFSRTKPHFYLFILFIQLKPLFAYESSRRKNKNRKQWIRTKTSNIGLFQTRRMIRPRKQYVRCTTLHQCIKSWRGVEWNECLSCFISAHWQARFYAKAIQTANARHYYRKVQATCIYIRCRSLKQIKCKMHFKRNDLALYKSILNDVNLSVVQWNFL